jgi:hypothetical protein
MFAQSLWLSCVSYPKEKRQILATFTMSARQKVGLRGHGPRPRQPPVTSRACALVSACRDWAMANNVRTELVTSAPQRLTAGLRGCVAGAVFHSDLGIHRPDVTPPHQRSVLPPCP